MFKSTLLTTLVAALLVGTATSHPGSREEPPPNPTATLTYANDAGTVRLTTPGLHYEVSKTCQGLQGDQGIVYAEVLTRYKTWNQIQAYRLELYPEWGCKEGKDPVTGKERKSVRVLTYAGHGEPMRDSDGEVYVPKSFRFVPVYKF